MNACSSCCDFVGLPREPLDINPTRQKPTYATKEIKLNRVSSISLPGAPRRLLVLETTATKALTLPKDETMKGRFQERSSDDIGVEVFQDGPKYRAMVKKGLGDRWAGTYDAVVSLIRTKEKNGQLVSMKMLNVPHTS